MFNRQMIMSQALSTRLHCHPGAGSFVIYGIGWMGGGEGGIDAGGLWRMLAYVYIYVHVYT